MPAGSAKRTVRGPPSTSDIFLDFLGRSEVVGCGDLAAPEAPQALQNPPAIAQRSFFQIFGGGWASSVLGVRAASEVPKVLPNRPAIARRLFLGTGLPG